MVRPRRRARTVLLLGLVAVAALTVLWWAFPPDPVQVLRDHAAPLARVERRPAPELGARVERWLMITSRGDTLSALWRSALPGTRSPWTVVLLGGLVSGERAALLVPESVTSHVLAVDWPWRGSRRLAWWQIALRLGDIRRAILRSPGVLALGTEAVSHTPECDSTRIVMLGVSLGVPAAVASLRLSPRPSALALLYGAADLRGLLRHGLIGEGVPAVLADPLAGLAVRLIHPLQPELHGAAVRARPVLVINSRDDPKLPGPCVLRLHRIFPDADVRWRGALHGAKDRRVAIAAAATDVQEWLHISR